MRSGLVLMQTRDWRQRNQWIADLLKTWLRRAYAENA